MESLKFFRRTFEDRVVEYYSLPWRSDIRLTRRFGSVFVHSLIHCPESGNVRWVCSSMHKSLWAAETDVLKRIEFSNLANNSHPALSANVFHDAKILN